MRVSTDQSDTSSQTSIRSAGPPFDDTNADVIIRSCDGFDFRVLKDIIGKASHAFNEMFTAQPASSMPFVATNYREDFVGSVPIVRVTEDRRTLDLLLRLFYPMDSPDLSELASIRMVLHALDKYMVDSYAETMHSALIDVAKNVPGTVYLIACRYSLQKTANTAAWMTVENPFHCLLHAPPADLAHVSGADYQRLLLYHDRCTRAAQYRAQPLRWIHLHCDPGAVHSLLARFPKCTCSRSRAWVWDGWSGAGHPNDAVSDDIVWVFFFLEACSDALKSRVHWETVMDDSLLDMSVKRASACPRCRNKAKKELVVFRKILVREIKTALVKLFLSMPLPFPDVKIDIA
ncbi:hypothetical protein EW146_g6485 [Bondarzewia mesenterica]|uniref:BTB domain-containing protein n=1 Tax=Bondarzewia mesenterica TaxID=1095465 RepID=A0A4V3XEJ5_9AGAM|nr:hypothetical protein EW146_g6485 [Bondarzewia mesenterica]